MTHVLTADLGNSGLKLRLFRVTEEALCVSAELVRQADLERPLDPDRLRAWLTAGPMAARVAVSSVASEDEVGEVVEVLAAPAPGTSVEVLVAPDAGLENRCREPERVGRDRLYAARAALGLIGGPAVVVDCGTALTVDAVAPAEEPQGSAGAFLGGAIAPGPALLACALGEGAAQLFTIEPDPAAPALGRDTRAALTAGVVHGLRGAAAHLVRAIAREAGFDEHALVVTGRAAGLLLPSRGAPDAQRAGTEAFERAIEVPDLVHHGLLRALGVEPPEPSTATA